MQRFIFHENIRHYTALLARTADAAERARVMNLLAEEVIKDLDAPADPEVEYSKTKAGH